MDPHRIVASFLTVVEIKARPELVGLHPHNRVDAGVEVFGFVKNINAKRIAFKRVAATGEGLIHQIVTWAYERPEVREVGSPWALDGPGGRSFTNEVHHDHLHIGVFSSSW